VLERVPTTFRGLPAVHPAPAVRHRRTLAWRPSCSRLRSAAGAAMHGQYTLHGLDPPISAEPLLLVPQLYQRRPARRNERACLAQRRTAVSLEENEDSGDGRVNWTPDLGPRVKV
jgi:hypothetical protein